ncbi:MAG: endoflagellar motor protein [Bdellovibrio sp.]|nr:MAG: endoflagellar motor protein [Bdellovibrio sp.]
MKSSFKWLSLSFCVAGLSACVSASKHEALQQEHATCESRLAADEKQIRDQQNKIHDDDVLTKDLEAKLGSTSSAKLQLEGNVAEMKNALEALTKQREEAERRIIEFRELTTKFKSLIDTGKLTIKIADGQMVVAMSSDILFPSGSARLSKEGISALKEVTSLLESVPNRKFQIEGYTDNIPIKNSTFPSNWELASARSMTVLKTMLEAGMAPERLSAASFGETHPVQSNDTDAGRTANRRIEIVVVPDLSTLPGYDQLRKLAGS